MPQPAAFATIIFLIFAWLAPSAPAIGDQVATDANLVTGLDVSDSIMRHHEWIEFDGVARAIVHPRFLEAVFSGHHGRIGFAVYVWSSHDNFRVIVPWTLIASVEDAERVAAVLEGTARIDRSHYAGDDFSGANERQVPSFRTDIAMAIGFGFELIASAPQPTERAVINVCGNGIDNVSGNPRRARDLALASGVTINGLVLGYEPDVAAYYRAHVTGGMGSFVMEVRDPAAVADAMVTKFLRDLVAVRNDAVGLPL
jgi:Ca-activated chloride channel family protein